MNKKILTSLFAGFLALVTFTACEKQNSEIQNISENTYAPMSISQKARSEKLSDKRQKEDLQKLYDLQFEDYEHMTISDFQSKVWEMTDTDEYRDYLDRLSRDEAFYQMKDSDDAAYFMFYILEPLTAENWQSKEYSGSAVSDLPYPSDNASLEYVFKLTILDANHIFVKDYNDLRTGVTATLEDVLKNRTKDELRNEIAMQADIRTYLDSALQYMQTPELQIEIEFQYFPLSAEEEQISAANNDEEKEKRRYSCGTKEDYDSLLALKTPDYQCMSIADFNDALLIWTNENYERMERIDEDIRTNDYQISLTSDELSFLKRTVCLSGMENGKAIQSVYAGTILDPYYGEYLPQKNAYENGITAWCSLYYQFSYKISDAESITVGERDRQIESMINAIHAFWNNTDIESMLKMSESDITQTLESITQTFNTDKVIISTDEEQVHFEHMDERGIIF